MPRKTDPAKLYERMRLADMRAKLARVAFLEAAGSTTSRTTTHEKTSSATEQTK